MASCLGRSPHKTFNKLLTCISRTSKHTQYNNHRRISSCTSASLFSNPLTQNTFSRTFLPTCVPQCRQIHSDGDKHLAKFLGKEIQLEEVKMEQELPVLSHGWHIRLTSGTQVTLQRVDENGECARVEFNIKDNTRSDDDDAEGLLNFVSNIDGYEDYEDPERMGTLLQDFLEDHSTRPVRYPEFTVEITKLSGNTMRFNCSLNTNIDEDFEPCDKIRTDAADENYLLFNEVQVYRRRDVDADTADGSSGTHIVRLDTRRRGRELQAVLMNTLLERGVDGSFVNSLVELASAIEHRHYIEFMKSLSKYASEE